MLRGRSRMVSRTVISTVSISVPLADYTCKETDRSNCHLRCRQRTNVFDNQVVPLVPFGIRQCQPVVVICVAH